MKRKSRPLMTGGLLGLAGLGLLPSGAEAAPDSSAVAPEPSLGTALAPDPHPVVVPEPSAQTTEPQLDAQGAPQPAWTPEGDQAVAAAAAIAPEGRSLTIAPQPQATAPVTIPQPEPSAPATAAAADVVPKSLEPGTTAAMPAESVALPATPAIAPAPTPEVTPADPAVQRDQTAIASPATPPVVAESVAESPETAAPAITPAETLAEISAKPAASKPALALQLPGVEPGPGTVSRVVDPALEDLASTSMLAVAPSPSPAATADRPVPEAVASTPNAAPRQVAPDVATLRSRATTVQALLRDLRTAYGLEIQSARPVSQPETVSRGPQLPPLPSRSAQPSPTAQSFSPQGEPVVADGRAALATAPRSQPRANPAAVQRPQLPSLPGHTANVALALPTPQPALSSGRSAQPSPPVELAAAPVSADLAPGATTAQSTPSTADDTADDTGLRDQLRVAPLTTTEAAQTFPPSPNAGIPSAFGANWGDVFFSASLAGADRLRPEADGSLSMGFGLGDSRRAVGVELAYNLQSIRRFGENGGFDAKVHRQVYSSDVTQVAAAVGLNNFASYGPNAGGSESSLYGVVTAAHLLQPDHPSNRLPITGSVGLGGGAFSGENSDVGVIAGVGLQVHPQFSVNTAWSGVGLNVGASIVPVATLPLTLNLLYGDIGNNTRAGSVAVLSIGYGFNFGPRF